MWDRFVFWTEFKTTATPKSLNFFLLCVRWLTKNVLVLCCNDPSSWGCCQGCARCFCNSRRMISGKIAFFFFKEGKRKTKHNTTLNLKDRQMFPISALHKRCVVGCCWQRASACNYSGGSPRFSQHGSATVHCLITARFNLVFYYQTKESLNN